jgi:uncharacterized membrane protein YgdD (TMEM256/DUF423 family)
VSGGRGWLVLAALVGASGVAIGAGGAHALRSQIVPEYLATFETGVRYHLLLALALLALALHAESRRIALPASLFTLGVLLFSGSLYALALALPSRDRHPFGGSPLLFDICCASFPRLQPRAPAEETPWPWSTPPPRR